MLRKPCFIGKSISGIELDCNILRFCLFGFALVLFGLGFVCGGFSLVGWVFVLPKVHLFRVIKTQNLTYPLVRFIPQLLT